MNKLKLALFAGLVAFSVFPALAQRGPGSDECILDNCRDRRPSGNQSQGNQPQGNQQQDNRRNRDYDREPRRDRFSNDRPGRDDRFDDRPYGRDRFNEGPRRGGGGSGERYGARPGEFDFYVLALSWSPSFCNSQAGRRSREQCAVGANNAFVVHGLWPQFDRGFPSYCRDQSVPRFALEQARGVFPEEGLARYEWRKHGTCSGLSPSEYFTAARKARDMVKIPEEFSSPKSGADIDPMSIQRAFVEANRTLRPGMLAVTCTRGQLEEVRVCISKDLHEFRPCPEVVRAACRVNNVSMPPPR